MRTFILSLCLRLSQGRSCLQRSGVLGFGKCALNAASLLAHRLQSYSSILLVAKDA